MVEVQLGKWCNISNNYRHSTHTVFMSSILFVWFSVLAKILGCFVSFESVVLRISKLSQ